MGSFSKKTCVTSIYNPYATSPSSLLSLDWENRILNTGACGAHIFFPCENGTTIVSGFEREKGGGTVWWSAEVGEYGPHSSENLELTQVMAMT